MLCLLHRTPLHCAASCNNVQVCKFLVESGAAVFAMTYSDMQTAADKCEEMEEGYTQCSQFLYGMQPVPSHVLAAVSITPLSLGNTQSLGSVLLFALHNSENRIA